MIQQEYYQSLKMRLALSAFIEMGYFEILMFQQPLGIAFDSIPPGTYYPAVCMYYGEVQVTLNPKAKVPSEEKK